MRGLDLTVAVTAHNETLIAGPCMLSADSAIHEVEKCGFSVERLVGLDIPTDECRTFFNQSKLDHWSKVELEMGDPFKSRNALVERGRGKWIAFIDADDLVSENWLAKAIMRLARAEMDGEKIIVHPELNWIFEGAESVFTKQSMDDPLFLPHYLYFANYYDMMAMAPRKVALEIPYAPRDLRSGFGYQDWQWNIETIDAGWRHVTVKDTVIFKRRRIGSVSEENRERGCVIRALEPMAIDRVRELYRR